ncbi:MAG: GDSL-type esterase/lipase family protein [Candidatus Saccharimonadales bacterium]|jgi:lysophospholipase L1-like esterase
MKSILIYGDSNTYGEAAFHRRRLPYDDRWTSKLQKLLDQNTLDARVISEGLSGRIAGDYKQHDTHTNGLRHFEAIYRSHVPIDILIIALGTNDMQPKYKQTAEMIFDNLMQYRDMVRSVAADSSTMAPPHVVYLIPPLIHSREDYFIGDVSLIKKMTDGMKRAKELFIESGAISLSEDGVHISSEGHSEVAEKVYKKIRGLL